MSQALAAAAALPPHVRHLIASLRQATAFKDVSGGQALHANFLKTGSLSFPYISNTLLAFYGKSQLFPQAHLLFAETPRGNDDPVPWNILINAYSQVGSSKHSLTAIQLFREMIRGVTYPNSHTLTGFFASASHLGNSDVAWQGHCVATKLDGFDDVFVCSSLLNVYCKVGLMTDARKMFDEMPLRNSITWSTMISGYASWGMGIQGFATFKGMVSSCEGAQEFVNEFILTSVLSGLVSSEYLNMGRQIHCLAAKNGLLGIVSVGNAMVTMYSKCGSLHEAANVFEVLSDRNSITWSAMITGHAQCGEGNKSLKLFEEMHHRGMKPSEYTLVGVLNASSDVEEITMGKQVHAYLIKLGFESHIYIMTALIDMYAKCGCVADAEKGFVSFDEPDLVLWTSMIGGYVQNGNFETAINLYCKMQRQTIPPNELTMASVLKACSSLSALEQGKQFHAHVIKNGFTLEVPIGSALSTMYVKCGSIVDGDKAFTRMPSRDAFSWNAMISGLSQNGQGKEALELFEQMQVEGAKPDHVTFVNVLSLCSHMGLVQKGWEMFHLMSENFGLDPRVEHYACMVDLLGRAGMLVEAKEFIESAKIEHGFSLWRILLSACRNHRNYELGAYAGEKLIELGSNESSAYVLLSSIYTAQGRVEDVERVRRIMSVRGISKEPGCSWIEIKNRVHVFVVGDILHSDVKEIDEEVLSLGKMMKDEVGSDEEDDLCLEEMALRL